MNEADCLCSPNIPSVLLLSPPLRTLTPQIIQAAPQPAVSSSNTTKRVSSRGTCSTCRSTTSWLSSGVSTSSSLWGSAPLRGPLRPTTGPSPNQTTSPCSLFVPASYAHSGRLLQIIFATIDFPIDFFFFPPKKTIIFWRNCSISVAKRTRRVWLTAVSPVAPRGCRAQRNVDGLPS